MKSSEISAETLLYDNGDNLKSKVSQFGIRAIIQKQILKQIIQGFDIDDIETELRSLFEEKGAKFDTYIQKDDEVREYSNKINIYKDYYNRLKARIGNTIQLEETLTEEDFVMLNNKKITPSFDYLYEDADGVHIVKIKTTKISSKNPVSDLKASNDMYAIGLWAREKFPDKPIFIDYDYLTNYENKDNPNFIPNYEDLPTQLSFNLEDTFPTLESNYETSLQEGCNPDNCGKCGRNELCNFKEPPIDIGMERVLVPLESIHFTDAQRSAIEFDNGIARVIAGAGAGKTLVVAARVVQLIKNGVDPSKIVMLTYTKTGSKEMTERVIRYLAGQEGILVDPSLIKSGTINSFGQDILNEHYEELGYSKAPVVCPEEMQYMIINQVLDEFPQLPEWKYRPLIQSEGPEKFANQHTALMKAKSIFSQIKKNKWTIDNHGLGHLYPEQSIAYIFLMYQQYELKMKEACFIDYDDQLDLVLKLAEENPRFFDEYGFEHIIMDEYQDSNEKQLEIAKALIDANTFKSFMGVGDDSQSIFGFQDATPEFIVHFEQYFGQYTDFPLLENHRSSRNIVNNANKINALVDDRVEKDLIATKDNGSAVEVQGYYTKEAEYEFIANDIKQRIERGEDPSSICVLAGTGEELRNIASYLTKLEIPSVLMNPVKFRQNSRVVALCDFFDSFMNRTPKGMVLYENVLQRGSLKNATKEELDAIVENKKNELSNTPKTLEKFLELAANLDENKTDVCYQDFLERISYCRSMEELTDYFEAFELYGFDSACNKTKEGHYAGVNLITVHSAKGLEWDTTYLTLDSFDNKKFHDGARSRYNGNVNKELNEKRRLWFVGATRAKENLVIVGQYNLEKKNKDMIMQNQFLRKQYELVGKPYDYNTLSYLTAQAELHCQEEETTEATRD